MKSTRKKLQKILEIEPVEIKLDDKKNFAEVLEETELLLNNIKSDNAQEICSNILSHLAELKEYGCTKLLNEIADYQYEIETTQATYFEASKFIENVVPLIKRFEIYLQR